LQLQRLELKGQSGLPATAFAGLPIPMGQLRMGHPLPVLWQYLAHRLCGPPMIVFEDTTEPLSTVNRTALIDRTARILDQLVVEPLVIALQRVVLRVFLHGLAKVTLAQWDNLGQTL
jgi:hypothetical protein